MVFTTRPPIRIRSNAGGRNVPTPTSACPPRGWSSSTSTASEIRGWPTTTSKCWSWPPRRWQSRRAAAATGSFASRSARTGAAPKVGSQRRSIPAPMAATSSFRRQLSMAIRRIAGHRAWNSIARRNNWPSRRPGWPKNSTGWPRVRQESPTSRRLPPSRTKSHPANATAPWPNWRVRCAAWACRNRRSRRRCSR